MPLQGIYSAQRMSDNKHAAAFHPRSLSFISGGLNSGICWNLAVIPPEDSFIAWYSTSWVHCAVTGLGIVNMKSQDSNILTECRVSCSSFCWFSENSILQAPAHMNAFQSHILIAIDVCHHSHTSNLSRNPCIVHLSPTSPCLLHPILSQNGSRPSL
jgi:hypothetical protein